MPFLSRNTPDPRYIPSRTTAPLMAETVPRHAVTGTATPVAGTYYFHRISLAAGAYSTVTISIPATAGATLANCFVGLHDLTLAKVAGSTDQSTNWQSAGNRTTTLAFTVPAAADYYIGLLVGSGGTIPVPYAASGASAPLSLAPIAAGKHNTTGLTAVPDPLVAAAAAGFLYFWMRYE